MKSAKRPIMIVQGASSALLYIQECRSRGIEPIVINPPEVNPDRAAFSKFTGKIRTIDMKSYDQYDEILEKVRKLDPQCVVCGNSGGVTVADRLARDLGLNGNDPETTALRDTKDGMHRALKDAGLRYIRTAIVKSKKDVEEFWKKDKIKKAMMKFSSGAAAVGNKACPSLEESLRNLDTFMKGRNFFGNDDNILIQEFIEGDEYVVDTVSCDGMHMVCAVWKYHKRISPDGDVISDETILMTDPEPGFTELIEYAYKVLDATGFKYGACHGEYKIDANGPVLMETNARPHGTTFNTDYLDEFLDNHITDASLDAYICPDKFMSRMARPYRPKKYAMKKYLFSPKECDIDMTTMARILGMMSSFRYSPADFGNRTVHIDKTIDLETVAGTIMLCNSDREQLERDRTFINMLETKYFDLLERSNDVIEGVDVTLDAHELRIEPYWRTLLLSPEGESLYCYGKIQKVPADLMAFDALVYADASETTVADRLASIMSCTRRLSVNGVIVILPEVYHNLSHGREAVELILYVMGFTINMPRHGFESIIATRYRK